MDFRTDEEVLELLEKKTEDLKIVAKGDGFLPIQARMKLKAIENLSIKDKIKIGRDMFIKGIN